MLPALLVIGAFLFVSMLSSLRILREYERAIVFRLGRAKQKALGPGVVLHAAVGHRPRDGRRHAHQGHPDPAAGGDHARQHLDRRRRRRLRRRRLADGRHPARRAVHAGDAAAGGDDAALDHRTHGARRGAGQAAGDQRRGAHHPRSAHRAVGRRDHRRRDQGHLAARRDEARDGAAGRGRARAARQGDHVRRRAAGGGEADAGGAAHRLRAGGVAAAPLSDAGRGVGRGELDDRDAGADRASDGGSRRATSGRVVARRRRRWRRARPRQLGAGQTSRPRSIGSSASSRPPRSRVRVLPRFLYRAPLLPVGAPLEGPLADAGARASDAWCPRRARTTRGGRRFAPRRTGCGPASAWARSATRRARRRGRCARRSRSRTSGCGSSRASGSIRRRRGCAWRRRSCATRRLRCGSRSATRARRAARRRGRRACWRAVLDARARVDRVARARRAADVDDDFLSLLVDDGMLVHDGVPPLVGRAAARVARAHGAASREASTRCSCTKAR